MKGRCHWLIHSAQFTLLKINLNKSKNNIERIAELSELTSKGIPRPPSPIDEKSTLVLHVETLEKYTNTASLC
jgi:hypothetical protein